MTRQILFILSGILVLSVLAPADTFKHRQTGQVFHGFATQTQRQGQTLVYNAGEKTFKPIPLAEYDVTRNKEGRRDTVYVLPIDQPEILLSKVVSDSVAQTLVEASNQGPLLIILDIDNPGGQGPYMRTIATAIANTTNCSVVAYIRGEKHGGAYSAAAVLALACEKIYISPSAILGSLAPIIQQQGHEEMQAEFLQMYSPDGLAAFGTYAASLAQQKERNAIVARALLDRMIDVVEVQDLDGKKSVINVEDRSTTQRVLRHLSQVAEPIGPAATAAPTIEATAPVTTGRYVMTLMSTEAIQLKLADKLAESHTDILRDMDAGEGRIMRSRSIEEPIRKYTTTKRNISQSLANIDQLQAYVDELQQQIGGIEEQIRTGTVTREYRQGDRGYRTNQDRYSLNDPYRYWDPYSARRSSRDRANRGTSQSQTLRAEQPAMSPDILYGQLNVAVNDLIREYRRVLSLAGRFPGALPVGLTTSALQQRLDIAVALQTNLRRRAVMMYQQQPY
ncbi:MAG: hypothetical protein JW828_06685 [Sedimentisphaerales bacterium]|nr:hypothetical protein [Sedimentisphaerales bacterium]